MSLSNVLEVFKEYDDYIDSISYFNSDEDFTLEIVLNVKDEAIFYSANLDVYSNGSTSVRNLNAEYCGGSTDTIDINFLTMLVNMSKLWYNTIKR